MGSEGVTGVERMAPGMGRLHAFPRRRIRVVVVGGQGAGTRLAARLAGFASIELIDVAFEATDALGLVDAAGPDIVFVDLGLGQALELIARLRERLPSVHVVAHVAVASERLAEAALAAGADVCAVESVSDTQLVEALARPGSPYGRTDRSGRSMTGPCPAPCAPVKPNGAPSTACGARTDRCVGSR